MSFQKTKSTNLDIPIERQPSFVLSVETEELFINAGLQDRVVQIYEGLVFMDFNEEHMNKMGHGVYKRLPSSYVDNLPLFIAYENDPSDSGKIHSTVRQQWNDGVKKVRKVLVLARFEIFFRMFGVIILEFIGTTHTSIFLDICIFRRIM